MMNEDEITALAKGMAPFVRECVDQAICKMIIVPPELAAQIANAARLLHELPPIEQQAAPRLIRIERDAHGSFVPIYGEPQA